MATLPPAIFFINGDITYPPTQPVFVGAMPNNLHSDASASELTSLQTQLFINDTMSKAEFDARVAADPNYPTIVHLQNLRILVILPSFQDGYNRQYADVVMFLHQGLADIEYNLFGPPCQNFPIQRLNMYALLRAVGSPNVVILPSNCTTSCCDTCNYPFYCDCCHTFSGIQTCSTCGSCCQCGCTTGLYDQQGLVTTPVHLPNCDNEYNNTNFINRK